MGVVFVDFLEAFDPVSRNILLRKLKNAGIGGDVLLWLKDYLANRKQFVSIDGENSEVALVPYEVPQGSVLAPVLFSMFIGDLPAAVQLTETYLYAGDTTIYCIAESVDAATTRLNRALAELKVWYNNNNLIPHPGQMQSNAYVPRKLHRTRPTTKLRTQQHRMDKLRKATRGTSRLQVDLDGLRYITYKGVCIES